MSSHHPGPLTRAAAAFVTLLALSACAADGDPAGEDAAERGADAGLLPTAEGTTEYPLTIETTVGPAVVEERPERVAVVGFSTNLDVLEVLDVVPVYAITEEAAWEWRDPAWLDRIETIDEATRRDPVNLEKIALARPDLIIALNSVEEPVLEQLNGIAPVVDYAEPQGERADWREGQRLVGEALDLSAAADAAIADADRAVAEVAADHPEFRDRTVTIATEYTTGVEYYTSAGGTAEGFMTDLGFTPNPRAEDFTGDPVVSEERLTQLDADVLVVSYLDEEGRRTREASPLFEEIPAVADGRYVAVVSDDPDSAPNAIWVLRRGASALSLPWAAEAIADEWLAEVDLAG